MNDLLQRGVGLKSSANDYKPIIHLLFTERSLTRGTIALCAPERIDSPITWTSSCRAAFTIISGVCRSPVVSVQAKLGNLHTKGNAHIYTDLNYSDCGLIHHRHPAVS